MRDHSHSEDFSENGPAPEPDFLQDWGNMIDACSECSAEERHDVLREAISAFICTTPSNLLAHYLTFLDSVLSWSEEQQTDFVTMNVATFLPGFSEATLMLLRGIPYSEILQESSEIIEGQIQLRLLGLVQEPKWTRSNGH